jgi:hypothetical protein
MGTNDPQQSLIRDERAEQLVRDERTEQLAALIDKSGCGSTADVILAAGFMRHAVQQGWHLVSPASTPPRPPIGCEYSFSRVVIDPDPKKGQIAIIEGKPSLSKTALNQIAKMAGVRWDDARSGRTDDGSDPNFASYKAVGWYIDFDGQKIPITGEKTMDLRDTSERAKKMKPHDLQQSRFFIAEHAETKAKNRALRGGLALQTSYLPDQLGNDHPFVVVKLALNGRTSREDDPDGSIQHHLTLRIADSMLDASLNLYGQKPELPPLVERPELGAAVEHPASASALDASGENAVTAGGTATFEPDAPQSPQTPNTAPPPWTIPVGQHKGKTLDDPSISVDALNGVLDLFLMQEGNASDAKTRDEAKWNQGRVLEELARRKQSAPPETGGLKL